MMEEIQSGADGIIGLKVTGMVTDNDYRTVLIPRLESTIKEHGKARVLFHFGSDFHGYELSAVWDDVIVGLKHRNSFEKCAVVGGPKWVNCVTHLAAPLIKGEVKTFPSAQLDDAWIWIRS